MKEYNIKLLETAVDDLDEIILYIASENKNAAFTLKDEIINKINELKKFPKFGRFVPEKQMREKGYRMLLVKSYLIFYRILGDDIYIYRILHGPRDYPNLFNSSSS
ncbi:MAG: type II toxin-antitoxin system RelE/ParE family toxin [Halanaerobiaceae bacterium]